jgi:hypothetical protein
MRPPSGPDSGPSIRIQPLGRTCQSQLMTVPAPSGVWKTGVGRPDIEILDASVAVQAVASVAVRVVESRRNLVLGGQVRAAASGAQPLQRPQR